VRRRERPALVRRRGEDLRLRLAALNARQPFLNPILAYFFGSPGLGTWKPSKEPLLSYALMRRYSKKRPPVKAHEGATQLCPVLLDPESLLVRVAPVAGFFPLFARINEVLIDFASTGARFNVCNHPSLQYRLPVSCLLLLHLDTSSPHLAHFIRPAPRSGRPCRAPRVPGQLPPCIGGLIRRGLFVRTVRR